MRGVSRPCRLALAGVLGAAVLGVAAPAAAADWTRPFDLSGALTQASLPSVGINDAGGSLFAWQRTVTGVQRIQIRNRSATGALGSVANISSSLSATLPDVEMNAGGTAAILYLQFDGHDDRLAVNVRTGGTTSAQQLVSGSGSSISDFAGGIDASGRALLVWRNIAGVRARFRAANGTLGPTKDLANTPGASHPRVAVNDAGQCAVVWTQDLVVHIRSCSTATSTFGADKIASADVADDPEVGLSDAGRAVVVWSRFDNPANENRIEARVLTTSGSLATTKTIDTAAAGSPLFLPHVAVDGAGLAGIAYRAEDVAGGGGIINIVKAATLPTSNTPTAPVPFSRDDQDTGEPAIAIDDAGRSDVVWPVIAGVNSHITLRPLAANGTGGTRLTLSDLATSMDDPDIAKNGAGAGAAVWNGNNETDDVVQGAFDPAP